MLALLDIDYLATSRNTEINHLIILIENFLLDPCSKTVFIMFRNGAVLYPQIFQLGIYLCYSTSYLTKRLLTKVKLEFLKISRYSCQQQ